MCLIEVELAKNRTRSKSRKIVQEGSDYTVQNRMGSGYKLEQIKDMYKFIKSCEYGFIGTDGKPIYSPSEGDFQSYRYSSPDEFRKNKIGTCWDFSAYEYDELRSYGINCKLLFINLKYPNNEFDTHTFVIANIDRNNFYYIEGAFRKYMGIYHVYTENEEEVVDIVSQVIAKRMLTESGHDKGNYWVYSYEDNQPPYGCTCNEFMEHIWDTGEDVVSGEPISIDTELDSDLQIYYEGKIKRVNDKGKDVPEKCDKCGSDVKIFLHGEPVWLCSNKKCKKYFGTVPCNIQESKLPTTKRNKLDDSDFGIPEKRQYPLHDKEHVEAAVRMFPHAPFKDRKKLAHRILSKAREYGMNTSGWESLKIYKE